MAARVIVVVAPLVLAAAAAAASPTAVVDGRESVVYAEYFGGFAIAYDGGNDGSAAPVTAFSPSALAADGSHTYVGSYLSWSVTYTVNWDLTQDYAIDSAAHRISGQGSVHLDQSSAVVGPNCAPCAATVSITGRDTQVLTFTLDAGAPYQFHSETTPGQWVELQLWSEPSQRWFALWTGAFETQGTVFDRSGSLAAGRYRLQNNPYDFTADGVPPSHDNAWSYSLTLPDAAVSAVPEPAGAALWLLGLAALGCCRVRRALSILAAAVLPLLGAPAAAQPMPIGDAYYAHYFYDTVERSDGAGGLAYDEVLAASGAQHGGALLKNHVVASSFLGVPGGGVVAAYNDGHTFWSQSIAPHIGGGNNVVGTRSQVYVAQSFRKDSIDAALSFSFSAGSLQLVDYGASRDGAPLAASARFSALVVEHATGLLEFEERQSVHLYETTGGFGGQLTDVWAIDVQKEQGPLASGAAPWSWDCDNCGRAAYGFATAVLQAPYTQDLRISGIALGEEFTVSFLLETAGLDLRQGETGAAAFAQDPLSGSGTGFSFSGLTPTNRPIISAVPESQSGLLLLAGAAFVAWRRRARA